MENIQCGPIHDRRSFSFSLPEYKKFNNELVERLYLRQKKLQKNHRIGVLVSGGLDSALMYYLVQRENIQQNNPFVVTPYTILRKEGSRHYAIKVINHIHALLNLPQTKLNVVGDNTLPEIQQVLSGERQILETDDFVYIGIIESRPEHSMGWTRYNFVETERVKYPLLKMQKSHIVDLLYQINIQSVIPFTHSCAIDEIEPCGHCNGCNERQWGFEQLNITG